MGRRICIVTGTRAEYGLLYWLMREIADDKDLTLQIVATAMHLEPRSAIRWIRSQRRFCRRCGSADGFQRDDAVAIARATGRGVTGLADAFERLQPDIVVLLGDRFETLAAATAAALLRIPVAHIHGGEIGRGDRRRHAARDHETVASALRRGRRVSRARDPDGRGAGACIHGGHSGSIISFVARRPIAAPSRNVSGLRSTGQCSRDLSSGDPRRERSRNGSRRIARRARSISGCSHRFHQGQCRCRRTGDQCAARIYVRPYQDRAVLIASARAATFILAVLEGNWPS